MNKRFLFACVLSIALTTLFAADGDIFVDSGQRLGDDDSAEVVLGDLDNDGDLDAFEVTTDGCKVWINDGNGNFKDSGQRLGYPLRAPRLALGDVNGDGYLDAFTTNRDSGLNIRVWLNDGTGHFSELVQQHAADFPPGDGVVLCDFDGDADLDAFIASGYYPKNCYPLLLNDGSGQFTNSAQDLYAGAAQGAAAADLNGDGHPDVYTASYGPDHVFLNDGNGHLVDSKQLLGNSAGESVALGDLDSDGDIDAFVVNELFEPCEVWINDGAGTFTAGWESSDPFSGRAVRLGDFDGDGDLDAIVANYSEPNKVWLNLGNAVFVDSGQIFPVFYSAGLACGDLDGDGDIDAYISNAGPDVVLLNQTYEPTPQRKTQVLVGGVNDLVSAGVLRPGQGKSLIMMLQNAVRQIDRSNVNAAINMIGAFIKEVNALINSGILSQVEGQPLIGAANGIIANLRS